MDVGERPPYLVPDEAGSYTAYPAIYDEVPELDAEAEAEYPRHGLVTSLAAIVRERADLQSPILGILRSEPASGSTRNGRLAEVFGGVEQDLSQGMDVPEGGPEGQRLSSDRRHHRGAEAEDRSTIAVRVLAREGRDDPVLPPPAQLRRAGQGDAAGRDWYAKHKREPMPTDRTARPGEVPAVVKEYMNSGYYVTQSRRGDQERAPLLADHAGLVRPQVPAQAEGVAKFQGRVLVNGADDLPLYFIRRELAFKQREGELSDVLIDTDEFPERLTTHPFVRSVQMGPKAYYEDEEAG